MFHRLECFEINKADPLTVSERSFKKTFIQRLVGKAAAARKIEKRINGRPAVEKKKDKTEKEMEK